MPPKRKLESSDGPKKSHKASENSTIEDGKKKKADRAALEAQSFLKGFNEKRSRRTERNNSEKVRVKKIKVKTAATKKGTTKKKAAAESSEEST